MTTRSTAATRLLLPVLLLAAVLLPAAPAAAHTRLAASAPAAGAAVLADTAQVVLSFTGEVHAELSTVVVTGPDGSAAARGRADVHGTDVVQTLTPPLGAGAWTVAYRVVAADGHPITGTVGFTVTAPGSAEPPGAPAAPPPPAEAPQDHSSPGAPVAQDPSSSDAPPVALAAVTADGGPALLPVLGGLLASAVLAAGLVLAVLRHRSVRPDDDARGGRA